MNNVTINFGPILILATVVLTVLKLMEVITVSWWIVTMPLWLGAAIGLGLLVIFGIIFIIGLAFAAFFAK